MAFTADHAMQLLDFSKKLDIGLLDGVVDCFYNGTGEDVSCVFFFFGRWGGVRYRLSGRSWSIVRALLGMCKMVAHVGSTSLGGGRRGAGSTMVRHARHVQNGGPCREYIFRVGGEAGSELNHGEACKKLYMLYHPHLVILLQPPKLCLPLI